MRGGPCSSASRAFGSSAGAFYATRAAAAGGKRSIPMQGTGLRQQAAEPAVLATVPRTGSSSARSALVPPRPARGRCADGDGAHDEHPRLPGGRANARSCGQRCLPFGRPATTARRRLAPGRSHSRLLLARPVGVVVLFLVVAVDRFF